MRLQEIISRDVKTAGTSATVAEAMAAGPLAASPEATVRQATNNAAAIYNHWTIDTQASTLGFSLRHIVVQEIRGQFTRWGGTISIDRDEPARSSVNVWIDLASIHTGDRSATSICDRRSSLTCRISRWQPSSAPRSCPRPGLPRACAGGSIKARIDRRKFGLRWNQDLDVGGIVVGDQIQVVAHVEATRAES